MGELVSAIAMRPVTFFVLLTLALLLLPSVLILYGYPMMKKMEQNLELDGYNALVGYVDKYSKVGLILVIVMMVTIAISIFVFVTLIVRAARREVQLCVAYMKAMEKITQAERKSMKKSLAFASVNHDIRGYLSCIKGLTELCYTDLSCLNKVETCADDVLALVNSILDFGKMEAGKMELEEKKFDLAQLVEEIADMHHLVAMKKGVEVILDPCDGSALKFSQVKGDSGKLKQIISNLLSNAVKFTSQGHISIKCHAKKPSCLENSIIASNRNNLLNRISRLFYKNNRAYDDLEEIETIKKDPRCVEFEFEVEDTGPGIPREKRRSIFEDFVLVKETSTSQTGIGLGLGIVQSLVRLMGGDIEIVEKADGLQGTCFKFNIFLIVQDVTMSTNNPMEEVLDQGDIGPSSRLRTCVHSIHKSSAKRSLVVLFIENDARRKMVHRYMESLGINMEVLSQWRKLSSTLKNLKSKLMEPNYYSSSSGRSDLNASQGIYLSSSNGSRRGHKLLPVNLMDDYDSVLPIYKRSKIRGPIKCVLLVIDCNAGDDFQTLRRSVSQFRKELYMICVKVVWLDRVETRSAHFQGLQDESVPASATDHIILEPLHGSRLSSVVRLLPEFGGDFVRVSTNYNSTRSEIVKEFVDSSSGEIKPIKAERSLNLASSNDEQEDHKVIRSSSGDKVMPRTTIRTSTRQTKISSLEGKRVLVVEDHLMQRHLSETCIKRLGAEARTCTNGKEAFEMVCEGLSNLSSEEPSQFPYDFILMDCQMPVMDGFEAAKRIREEEKNYGIHIPIIALTAHEVDGKEDKKISEAGLDLHLTKPLKQEVLLELINYFLG